MENYENPYDTDKEFINFCNNNYELFELLFGEEDTEEKRIRIELYYEKLNRN